MTTQYAEWLNAALDEINKDQRTRGKRYSQYKLAQESGVSQPALSRILRGETTNPEPQTYNGLITAIDQRLRKAYPAGHTCGEPPKLGGVVILSQPNDDIQATLASEAMDTLDEEVPEWHKSLHRGKLFTRYYNK